MVRNLNQIMTYLIAIKSLSLSDVRSINARRKLVQAGTAIFMYIDHTCDQHALSTIKEGHSEG